MNHNTKHLFLSLSCLLALFGLFSCDKTVSISDPESTSLSPERVFTLSVATPMSGSTRSIVKDLNSDDILLKWEKDAFAIRLVYHQQGVLVDGGMVAPTSVSTDGMGATIDFTVPQTIDIDAPFDLYAVIGRNVVVRNGKILMAVDAHTMYELTETSSNEDQLLPMFCEIKAITSKDRSLEGHFEHLGSVASIVVKNSSDKPLTLSGFAMVPKDLSQPFYETGSLPFAGNGDLPYIDLLDRQSEPVMIRTKVTYPVYSIAPGEVSYGGFWFRPTTETCPESYLVAYDADTKQSIQSTETKAERPGLAIGKAYYVYAEWDGSQLKFLDEEPIAPLPEDQSFIEITTSKKAGEVIKLNIDAFVNDRRNVWIDLNNNGTRERGEYVTTFTDDKKSQVTEWRLQSSTFRIYGEVSDLVAIDQGITSLDARKARSIESLTIDMNEIKTIDLSQCRALSFLSANTCSTEILTLPESGDLQELYIAENDLKELTIPRAGLFAIDVSGNKALERLSMTSGGYPSLMIVDISDCHLSKSSLESVYDAVRQPTIPKRYSWMYTIYSYGNPGSMKADYMIAVDKGWTVYQTSDETPDTTPLGPDTPDEPTELPLPALAYVAEYNLMTDGSFNTTQKWSQQEYLSYDEVTHMTLPEGYHLPSRAEFSAIFPMKKFKVYFNQNSIKRDQTEEIQLSQSESPREFKSDYYSTDQLVAYGLRYKDDTNEYLSAWRYEHVYTETADGDTDEEYLRVTARPLPATFDGEVEDIATPDFWSSNTEQDVVRIFPAAGFFAPVEVKPYYDHDGYFLTSTKYNKNKMYTADFTRGMVHVGSGGLLTDSFTIRLFKDR